MVAAAERSVADGGQGDELGMPKIGVAGPVLQDAGDTELEGVVYGEGLI